jgi:hypothetical protein
LIALVHRLASLLSPFRRQLAANLNTATALGLTPPPSILLRAAGLIADNID